MTAGYRIDTTLKKLSHSQIPLSIIMRWTVVIGIFLRIGSHLKSLITSLPVWVILLAIYSIYTIGISIIILKDPKIAYDKWMFLLQFIVDAFFCSIFFILSGNLDSDLYLNLLLPLLIMLEHVNVAHIILLYYFLWSFLLLMVFILMVPFCQTGCSYSEIIFKTFLPRVAIFLFIVLFVITKNNLIKEQADDLAAI